MCKLIIVSHSGCRSIDAQPSLHDGCNVYALERYRDMNVLLQLQE